VHYDPALQLTIDGPRIYVPVTINDTQGEMQIDTGSAVGTIIDTPFAEKAGVGRDASGASMDIIGVNGKTLSSSVLGHVRKLLLGDIPAQDWEFPIMDIGDTLPDKTRSAGILGGDLLSYFDIEIDIPAGIVRLWRPQGCDQIDPSGWKGDFDAIPMQRESSTDLTGGKAISIPIWLDGAFLRATVDTGSDGVLLLSREAALKAGVTAEELSHDPVSKTFGLTGSVDIRFHAFHDFLVGSEEFHNVTIPVQDRINRDGGDDALLGMGFLGKHRIWISYKTGTLFLQKIRP
jgi:predicted aspartyl protease